MKKISLTILLVCVLPIYVLRSDRYRVDGQEANPVPASREPIATYFDLLSDDLKRQRAAVQRIGDHWNANDAGMLIESARFASNRWTLTAILNLLEDKTEQKFNLDFDAWYQWLWNQEISPHPHYAMFKRELYRRIDPRFAEYFTAGEASTIRLDEIRWGGVHRDGIPPLSNPKTISAAKATYLNDSDVVFGVHFGGQSRAYPKRILAWHEMVKDRVGGLSINGVYCTLCGSMIIYETEFEGKHYELGTSGFLYRSNKLMYDHETKSMWSTLKGRPVVGKLVGQGIQLQPRYVVTTTWGQWKADHPDTDVLSLRTGHRRDYGEGVAYHDYFATDELMFTVPKVDKRLKNKDEVLIVRAGHDAEPVAIAAKFLRRNRVYQDHLGDIHFVVVTDRSGANRVYESGDIQFDRHQGDQEILSRDARRWTITENALVSQDSSIRLARLPAHRAFWFGWFADQPDVRLVK